VIRCPDCGHKTDAAKVMRPIADGGLDVRWLLPVACARCGHRFGRRRGQWGAWPVEPPRVRSVGGRPFPRLRSIVRPTVPEERLSPVLVEIVRYLLPLLDAGVGVAAAGRRLGLTYPQTRARLRALERLETNRSRTERLAQRECGGCGKPIPLDARRGTKHCPGRSACRMKAKRKGVS